MHQTPKAQPPTVELPRMPWRRRLLLVLLTLATSSTLLWLLLERPGDSKRGLPRPATPACERAPGGGCVGGRIEALLVAPPVPSAASAASSAGRR
ncbi:MAG TPA: hypothetical protein VFQ16_04350 [Burkholderiaceae bacterium]|nr:hypothetical protein [Burkholderiaceae bacterium]